MCGGSGEGEEGAGRGAEEGEEEERVGGGSGQGEVLVGAGSSGGGGDDKLSPDPPADPAGAPGLPPPNPAPASVPRAMGSGVAAVGERLSCDGSCRSAPSSRRSSPSDDVSTREGLPAAVEEQGEERGGSWGEGGVRAEESSFSIMVPTLGPPPLLLRTSSDVQVSDPAAVASLHERDLNLDWSEVESNSAAPPLSKYQCLRRSDHPRGRGHRKGCVRSAAASNARLSAPSCLQVLPASRSAAAV